MAVFSGIKGYYNCVKQGIPKHLFYEWLLEKWKADLKTLAWCAVMSPYLIIVVSGSLLILIGEAITSLKNVMPDCLFLPSGIRDKQIDAARKALKHKRIED